MPRPRPTRNTIRIFTHSPLNNYRERERGRGRGWGRGRGRGMPRPYMRNVSGLYTRVIDAAWLTYVVTPPSPIGRTRAVPDPRALPPWKKSLLTLPLAICRFFLTSRQDHDS